MIFSQIFSKILRSKATTLTKNCLPLFSAGLLVWISALLLTSCSVTKTVPIETIRKDTVYLSNIQYDSIYINRSSDTDRTRDTITITKTMTEYRYKFLRDTVRIVQRDSIPYEVRITETKEIRKPPNLFDYLCHLSFGILIGAIGWKICRLFRIL